MNSVPNQTQTIEAFVRKILSFLDETDSGKIQAFLQLFAPDAKSVFNSQPFAQPTAFLQSWFQSVPATQHMLTSLDYHVIPGTASVVCNINCKVRFEEAGRDRSGLDAALCLSGSQHPTQSSTVTHSRKAWGPYYGVSLQIVLYENALANPLIPAIASFNYTLVYRPEDSLINI